MMSQVKLKELEQNLDHDEAKEQYYACSGEINEIYDEVSNGIKIRSKCDWYEFGEKSSKFFLTSKKRRATQNIRHKLLPKKRRATENILHKLLPKKRRATQNILHKLLPKKRRATQNILHKLLSNELEVTDLSIK